MTTKLQVGKKLTTKDHQVKTQQDEAKTKKTVCCYTTNNKQQIEVWSFACQLESYTVLTPALFIYLHIIIHKGFPSL